MLRSPSSNEDCVLLFLFWSICNWPSDGQFLAQKSQLLLAANHLEGILFKKFKK